MSSYTLKFDPKKSDSSKNTFSVDTTTLSNAGKFVNVPNPAIKNNTSVTLQLLSLTYDKSLYAPCSISAEISVKGLSTAAVDELVGLFEERVVTFTGQAPANSSVKFPEIEIGKDYFVQSVNPIIKYNSKGNISSCRVSLTIYSRDYLLTEKKYSMSYLSKKFSTDIIKATLDGYLKSCGVGFTADTSKLLHIVYNKKELIQPYHVQYNEDFYSFIARIAARHGEFLFFEDGNLCLGIQTTGKAVELKEIQPDSQIAQKFNAVLSFQLERSHVPPQAPSYHQNYLHTESKVKYKEVQNKVGSDYKPTGPYFNEDSFDEYFDIYGTDDNSKPDNMSYEQPWGAWIVMFLTKFVPTLAAFSSEYAFSNSKAIADIVTNVGLELGKAGLRMKAANDTYISQVNSVPAPYSTEQKGTNAQCMFGSYTDATQKGNLMTAFYSAIRAGELESSAKMYKMTVKSCMTKLNVGDIIKFNDTEYIICRVYGDYSDGTDHQYIEVILRNKDNAKIFPPYNSCSEHPMAVPQTAVVEEYMDPRRLSRVRIRYPWQQKETVKDPKTNKDVVKYVPSPWVRLAQPLAGPNAVCNMVPRTGSEVMVDYIDGNIDRPYIIGCLVNSAVQPDRYTTQYGDREIRSETGSKLVLGTGNFLNWATDFVPFLGFASSLSSPFLAPVFAKMMTNAPTSGVAAGKVTLTDGYGFFTIEGDTAKRTVSIDSTLGKVTISALTGIEISSMLGDVTISGANIHLKAGNNITIESGLNIKSELDRLERKKAAEKMMEGSSTAGAIGLGALDITLQTVANLAAGALDMSFIRAIYEAICPPKEGTLKLKSYRYLQLEAGEGNAIDAQEGFVSEQFTREAIDKLDAISTFAATACNYSLKEKLVALSDARSALINEVGYNDTSYFKGIVIETVISNIISDAVSETKLKPEELIDKTEVDVQGYKTLVSLCSTLYSSATGLVEFVTGIQKGDNTKKLPDSLRPDVSDSYVSNMTATFGREYDLTPEGIGAFSQLSEADINSKVRIFQNNYFRYLVYKFASKNGEVISLTAGHPVFISSDCMTREQWMGVVSHIKLKEKEYEVGAAKAGSDFLAPFKVYTGEISSISSNWGPFQKGKILVSETKDQTIALNSNHNQWEAQKHDNLDYIKKYLMEK